ncbi:MAG: DNA-processing protein DprA, partial [Firmicutes bacterium]|nr:DNA-processing protein DprA [Bacillota bacterium]
VGTVVIEAGERSGSLLTASSAAEQGRDVFAVPGDAFGSTFTGGNKLIREGAKPVFSAMDVLEDYELLYPELLDMRRAERDLERAAVAPEKIKVKAPAKQNPQPPSPARGVAPQGRGERDDLPPLEQQILQLLSQSPMHIDRIMKETAAPYGKLFTALMHLEMQERIEQAPGKLYTKL